MPDVGDVRPALLRLTSAVSDNTAALPTSGPSIRPTPLQLCARLIRAAEPSRRAQDRGVRVRDGLEAGQAARQYERTGQEGAEGPDVRGREEPEGARGDQAQADDDAAFVAELAAPGAPAGNAITK